MKMTKLIQITKAHVVQIKIATHVLICCYKLNAIDWLEKCLELGALFKREFSYL